MRRMWARNYSAEIMPNTFSLLLMSYWFPSKIFMPIKHFQCVRFLRNIAFLRKQFKNVGYIVDWFPELSTIKKLSQPDEKRIWRRLLFLQNPSILPLLVIARCLAVLDASVLCWMNQCDLCVAIIGTKRVLSHPVNDPFNGSWGSDR